MLISKHGFVDCFLIIYSKKCFGYLNFFQMNIFSIRTQALKTLNLITEQMQWFTTIQQYSQFWSEYFEETVHSVLLKWVVAKFWLTYELQELDAGGVLVLGVCRRESYHTWCHLNSKLQEVGHDDCDDMQSDLSVITWKGKYLINYGGDQLYRSMTG